MCDGWHAGFLKFCCIWSVLQEKLVHGWMCVRVHTWRMCVSRRGRLSLLVVSALPFTQWLTLAANSTRLPHGQSHQSIQSRRHNDLPAFFWTCTEIVLGTEMDLTWAALANLIDGTHGQMACYIETSLTRRTLWSSILISDLCSPSRVTLQRCFEEDPL